MKVTVLDRHCDCDCSDTAIRATQATRLSMSGRKTSRRPKRGPGFAGSPTASQVARRPAAPKPQGGFPSLLSCCKAFKAAHEVTGVPQITGRSAGYFTSDNESDLERQAGGFTTDEEEKEEVNVPAVDLVKEIIPTDLSRSKTAPARTMVKHRLAAVRSQAEEGHACSYR